MDKVVTLEEVLNLAKQLSLVDKVSLNEQVARQIKVDLQIPQPKPRKSLYGLCADLGSAPSESEIDAVRREEWANFPREDI
jgi:hypothetical protein